jgi:hypothetical protein
MDFGMMTSAHFLYIPSVLLLGLITGYTLGARAVRADLERRKKQFKE